jgi:signal-induced proliferation-associated 1 like protein 3
VLVPVPMLLEPDRPVPLAPVLPLMPLVPDEPEVEVPVVPLVPDDVPVPDVPVPMLPLLPEVPCMSWLPLMPLLLEPLLPVVPLLLEPLLELALELFLWWRVCFFLLCFFMGALLDALSCAVALLSVEALPLVCACAPTAPNIAAVTTAPIRPFSNLFIFISLSSENGWGKNSAISSRYCGGEV